MTHPHSDQRNHTVYQRPAALSSYIPLVNASVSPLALRASAPISTHHTHHPRTDPVIDGEVITSTYTIPEPSVLRRALDDPYWILVTLRIALISMIAGTVLYGLVQITLAIMALFTTNSDAITGITLLVVGLLLCAGVGTAAKCAGIHCGGCKG